MKQFYLLLFFFINISFAQKNHEYFGFIKLNDTSLITYNVSFSEKKGELIGYSLTDLGGLHETKSTISGFYDEVTKVFKFKEYGIIYTKSPVIQNDFCFINFTANRVRLNSQKINGHFKGVFSDNTECISGEIFLSPKEKLEKRIEKNSKIIKRSKKIDDSIKEKIYPLKLMDTLKMNILRKEETLSVFSTEKEVRIEIYDGGQLDGDKITVKSNNQVLLDNYLISDKRKKVILNLNDHSTSFVLKADNVGSISTNTAVIEIFFGETVIKALTNLKAQESTTINLFLKN